jgi:hypothetical protein
VGGSLTSVDLLTGGILETIGLGGTITDIAREGGFLYTMNTSRQLRVVDITGGNMVARGSVFLPDGGGKLFVGNGIAYAPVIQTNGIGGFATADVSDPDNLFVISGSDFTPATGGPGTAIAVNGSGLATLVGFTIIFANDFDDFRIMNVSDPENTNDPGPSFRMPGNAQAVTIASGIAFVADGSAGLQVINYLPFDSQGQAPTVTISTSAVDIDPATPGVQVMEGTSIPIQANVTDDVQVRNVELLVNGQVVRNDVSFPFDFSAIALSDDPEATVTTVQVRATDTGGNVALSNTLTIDLVPDTFPPTIVSVEPANGATLPLGHRTVRVRFSESIDQAGVTSGNFTIVEAGADTVFGTGDDVPVPVTNIQLRSDDTLVQLTTDALDVGFYQFGIQRDAVTDRSGNALGTGVFTSDFEVVEAVPITITFGSFSHSHPLSYTESGLTVTSRQTHVHLESGRLRNHSSCCSTPYQFAFQGGAPFTVVSVDVISNSGSGSFTSSSGAVMPITGTGTITFPAEGWTNITSFRWDKPSGSTVIDNLTILATPSPMLLITAANQLGGHSTLVTLHEAEAIVREAVEFWATTLQMEDLPSVEVVIEDLPDGQIGAAQFLVPSSNGTPAGRITIDADGDGVGWFVDPTPDENEEFSLNVGGDSYLAAPDSPAAGRYDLFTVLLHEVGHVLGFGHIDGDGLMASQLPIGTRRLPHAFESLPDGTEPAVNETIMLDQALQAFSANDSLASTLGATIPVFVFETRDPDTPDSETEPVWISLSSPPLYADRNDYAQKDDEFREENLENASDDNPVPYLPEDEFDMDEFFINFDAMMDDLLAV